MQVAPSRANFWAMAAPIPRLPPVMRIFFWRLVGVGSGRDEEGGEGGERGKGGAVTVVDARRESIAVGRGMLERVEARRRLRQIIFLLRGTDESM